MDRSSHRTGTDIRTHLPFSTDAGVGERATIGAVVLASDRTLEEELRTLLDLPGVGFFASRIRNSNDVTPEALAAMEPGITEAADLILPGVPLDVVAYGCTSASVILGEERVFARVREARPEARCTTPVTAAFAAFEALGATRLAVLTPYRADVNEQVRCYVESGGYDVVRFGSFDEEDDRVIARIDAESLRRAATELARGDDVDAVFVSCTNLRMATLVPELERATGKPVTASNHALAWHALKLAGVESRRPLLGRLYDR